MTNDNGRVRWAQERGTDVRDSLQRLGREAVWVYGAGESSMRMQEAVFQLHVAIVVLSSFRARSAAVDCVC